MSAWWRDFSIKSGIVTVHATGARIPITWAYTKDTLTWFGFYLCERARSLPQRLFSKPKGYICALPSRPRAWYLFWAAAHRAGYAFTTDPRRADVFLSFQDSTQTLAVAPNRDLPLINFNCRDISKTRVAEVFEQVFGYSLAVDPTNYEGPVVCKSEENGAHDGHILTAPCPKNPDWTYQRLIDNTQDDQVVDIRCPTIGGDVPFVYLKSRPIDRRFDNYNAACALVPTEDYLSEDERAQVKQFCAAMGLDWGGLDILRDKADGRIYIVDVNKTDMGPPIVLPLRDKMRSSARLGRALTDYIDQERKTALATPHESEKTSSL